MKKIMLVVFAIVLMTMPAFAKDHIEATDIQKVGLGDTLDDVSRKIGEPQQVLSKELTADGKEKVIWQYETVKAPSVSNLTQYVGRERMATMSVYQQQRANNPPYLVIFIDGKVSKIKRQEIDPNTNKPVDIVVY